MEKKISFGFSKLSKKTNILNNVKKEEKKVELIECLEDQSIKVKDAVEEVKQPLVIPIKDNQKNLLDRIRDAKKRERPLEQKQTEPEDNRPDSELSVDELAARQLIREAKDRLAQRNNRNENKVSVLPLNQETSVEYEKEPTLEDYESVPISDYGLALLRGMGWKEGVTIGKNTSKTISVSVPEVRPKGLGLGASKIVQSEIPTKKPIDKDGKELILVKGAYAKVIAGVKKGNYCQVQGFDEEAGRVIVKVYPKGDNLNVNEFMLVPVTKEEFSKGSKILNNAKYEEYLEISDKKLEKYKIKEEDQKLKNDSLNPDLESEGQSKGSKQKSRKYNNDVKDSPISGDERGCHSKQKDGHISNKSNYNSTDSEDEVRKTSRTRTKSKYRDRSRSRGASSKKEKNRRRSDSSSDDEYYEKEKRSNKHTKSKYEDRSRDESRSRDKYKKSKKYKKHRRDSSSSESDFKRDKRKKNKCKSRHRRNSSSSSIDRKNYRNKK